MSGYHRIFGRLAAGAPLGDLLNILVSAAEETHPGVRASISLLDTENNTLQLISAPSLSDFYKKPMDNLSIAADNGCGARAAYLGERILIEDIDKFNPEQRQLFKKEGITACLAEPIKNIKQEVLGSFELYFSEPKQIQTIDDAFIQVAINLAATAIEQRVDQETEEAPKDRFESIVMERVTELLNGRITQLSVHGQFEQLIATLATHFIKLPANAIDESIKEALQSIGEFFDQERGTLFLLNSNDTTISATHSWCAKNTPSHIELHQDIDMAAFPWGISQRDKKHGLYCNDIDKLPPEAAKEYDYIKLLEVKSFALVPMLYGHKTKGFLSFSTAGKAHNWNDEDIALLSLAGDMLINAIRRKHYDEIFLNIEDNLREVNSLLAKEAREDGLTHIANRRYFDAKLNQEYRRAAREGTILSLIICDVDCFKNYNDAYGHVEGDSCLIKIASTITDCFQRAADLPARYGGEEFAIILPNTGENESELMAERLRAEIENLAIPHSNSSVSTVITISVGCATLDPESCNEVAELIKAADQALYEAKDNGRNCIAVRRMG